MKKNYINWRWVEDGSMHGKTSKKKSHCEIENKLKYNIILTILVYIICTTYMYFISLL